MWEINNLFPCVMLLVAILSIKSLVLILLFKMPKKKKLILTFSLGFIAVFSLYGSIYPKLIPENDIYRYYVEIPTEIKYSITQDTYNEIISNLNENLTITAKDIQTNAVKEISMFNRGFIIDNSKNNGKDKTMVLNYYVLDDEKLNLFDKLTFKFKENIGVIDEIN